MHISVIICTHNPRDDYLWRTLDALKQQTMTKEQWELLLIDNASERPLDGNWDLSWHPYARHVREDKLGLTPARLRGIGEAKGELLVFVDDDNVLNHDYLLRAFEISRSYPWVASFGGSTIGEFESPPAKEIESRLIQLAVRKVERTSWACLAGTLSLISAPCGAGMVVRRYVAEYYASAVAVDDLRLSLDRCGSHLASGGDSDLAYCACELGCAVGLFPDLSLKHLIPPRRLEKDYLVRLAEAMSYSHAILRYRWDGIIPDAERGPPVIGRAERLLRAYQAFRVWLLGAEPETFTQQISAAELEGLRRARRDLLALDASAVDP